MTGRLHATCHCGKVRMTLPAEAAGALACHCGDCRTLHGNFNAFLAVARADLAPDGDEALVWYQSSPDSRRAFCGTCGAGVVKEQTADGRRLISAGLIEGASGKRIIRNLWVQSKPDWYDLPDVEA
ncbi:MAG: GFA family protein [Pseudomonadota bacterium]